VVIHALATAGGRMRWGLVVPGLGTVLAAWVLLIVEPRSHTVGDFAPMWVAMTLAMMVPTVLRPMARAADGSPARAWAFVLGFVSVWCAAGVPAFVVLTGITWTPFWTALLWLGVGAYQVMPGTYPLLSSCSGIRFHGDPVRYGARQGLRCVASCGPIMVGVMATAMLLPGLILPLALLVGLTVLLCWEKSARATARSVAAVGVVLVALAAGSLVLGVGSNAGGHHESGTSIS
jgi:hypothetical protein